MVRESGERIFLSPQFLFTLFNTDLVSGCQVLSAHTTKLISRQALRHRPANQGLAPGEVLTRDGGLPGGSGRRIAIVNV
jgi:hypothetical protein